MSDEASQTNEPFDLERLKELIEMMEKHGLTEVSLRRGDEKWRLRRGPQEVVSVAPPTHFVSPAGQPQPVTEPVEAPRAPPQAEEFVEIKSPTVGTFYTAPTPDDPPFVTVGSTVEPDTIVGTVEAMKVFNQIPAEVSGTIIEIRVQNGDSVEFGQPLFRVRPL